MGDPWGYLGVAGRSLGGPWGGPVGIFKRSWQLLKSLKNHLFLLCFQPWRCPGGSLGGRWGARGTLRGPRGGSSGITWGFWRSHRAQSEDPWRICDHLRGSLGRLRGPWGGARGLRVSLMGIEELVLMGPGPPLSYKLKLIAQRKIDRSDADPSLRGSNTPLGRWPGEFIF